jgi:hypothetical protein
VKYHQNQHMLSRVHGVSISIAALSHWNHQLFPALTIPALRVGPHFLILLPFFIYLY